MKLLATKITFLMVLMTVTLGVMNMSVTEIAAAKSYIPVPEVFCGILPCPQGTTGVEMAKSLVGRLIDNTRYIIGAIAILMIVVAGVKLIASSGNEEVLTKQSATLVYAIMGLFMVGLAGEVAMILEVDRGGFLKDGATAVQKARLFSRTVEILITFIKYIIGSVAVVFIIRNGIRMIILGGTEEEVTKDKKNILWGFLGLIIILMANPIINNVFFKIDKNQYPGIATVRPGIDTKRLLAEVVGATNVLAAIVGPFAILSLVVGGVLYTFSAGQEELQSKAKKIITWALIGIVIIYGSFAVVSTFVSRQFEGL